MYKPCSTYKFETKLLVNVEKQSFHKTATKTQTDKETNKQVDTQAKRLKEKSKHIQIGIQTKKVFFSGLLLKTYPTPPPLP